MRKTNFHQIAYMPYAPIKEGFQVGNYEIWPFYKESNKRINNQKVIEQLTCLFRRYFEWKFNEKKGGYDKPLEEVYIISPTNEFEFGTSKFSKDQIEDIRIVNCIMAFCAINDFSSISASSDSFILYVKNFQVGLDGITLWDKLFTNLEMVKFMKPYHLEVTQDKFDNSDLCKALGNAIQFKDRSQIRKIFRTLELFYHTATYSEMIIEEHKILSLVMCFEVLLNIKSKHYKKEEFAEKIESIVKNYEPSLETRLEKKYKGLEHSKTGWWAYDLYDLRNAIIHGDEVNWDIQRYGDTKTRIKFGGILLRKLIKEILSQESLWPLKGASDSDIYQDAIIEADRLDIKLENMVAKFNEVHIGNSKKP